MTLCLRSLCQVWLIWYSNEHGNLISSENQLELYNYNWFWWSSWSLKGKACLKTESVIWSFSRNLFTRVANLKQLLNVKYKALHT